MGGKRTKRTQVGGSGRGSVLYIHVHLREAYHCIPPFSEIVRPPAIFVTRKVPRYKYTTFKLYFLLTFLHSFIVDHS